MSIVVFDLDSTLADTRGRRQHLPVDAQGPADWIDYHVHCMADEPVRGTIQLAQLLYRLHRIVIVTARPDVAEIRELTVDWLDRHDVPCNDLILMPTDSGPSASAWKVTVVEKLRADGAEVVLLVDDWGPNGRMIEEALDVPFLHVARPGADSPQIPSI